MQPVNYNEVLNKLESSNNTSIQDALCRYELTLLAQDLKQKFPTDKRTTKDFLELIVEELFNGRWDYRQYLKSLYL